MKNIVYLIALLLAAIPLSATECRDWRIREIIHQLDAGGTGILQNTSREVIAYDPVSTACVDSVYTFSWQADIENPSAGFWFQTEMQRITWNAAGTRVDLTESYFQPGFPAFCQTVRQYDGEPRLTDSHYDIYFNDVMETAIRRHYLYEGDLLTFRDNYYFEHFSHTFHYSRNAYTHDGQGRFVTEDSFTSEDSLNWIPDRRWSYTYHPEDSSTGREYIQKLSQYDITSYIFDIPAYGKLVEMSSQDCIDNEWYNSERIICTYDANVRLQSIIRQHYADGWVNYRRTMYDYDQNGNLATASYQNWNPDASAWMMTNEKIIVFWENTTPIDDETNPPENGVVLSVHPNPFFSSTMITLQGVKADYAAVSIYNCKGQLVKKLANAGQNCIWDGRDQYSQLVPRGIYFLQAKNGKTVSTRKLLRM